MARGSPPCPCTGRRRRQRAELRQIASVRVSCQTIALYTGSPVARSHTSAVSRWLVMPTAAMSAGQVGLGQRSGGDLRWSLFQISIASCSTHPALGRSARAPSGRPRRPALPVEDHAAGGRGALVDRRDVLLGHLQPPGVSWDLMSEVWAVT